MYLVFRFLIYSRQLKTNFLQTMKAKFALKLTFLLFTLTLLSCKSTSSAGSASTVSPSTTGKVEPTSAAEQQKMEKEIQKNSPEIKQSALPGRAKAVELPEKREVK